MGLADFLLPAKKYKIIPANGKINMVVIHNNL